MPRISPIAAHLAAVRRMLAASGVALGLAGFAAPAVAQYVETTWTVTDFIGEAWFVDPAGVIGGTQAFEGGYAEGVFFGCDFNGLSMTYTAYSEADFLANPEFALFAPFAGTFGEQIFVHRITCNGGGDPALRRVLYPFVTTDTADLAWYLFEGGVFTLVDLAR